MLSTKSTQTDIEMIKETSEEDESNTEMGLVYQLPEVTTLIKSEVLSIIGVDM
jgi:hypothetical protein